MSNVFVRLIFVILPLLAGLPGLAVNMNEPDKELHYQASAGISMASYSAFRLSDYSPTESALYSFGLTLAVGFIKESTDSKFDPEDMQANTAGAVSGIVIPFSFTF
jgi:hypothetical protein